jgi:oligoribonuclease (3'-5' exoribonuclease)
VESEQRERDEEIIKVINGGNLETQSMIKRIVIQTDDSKLQIMEEIEKMKKDTQALIKKHRHSYKQHRSNY